MAKYITKEIFKGKIDDFRGKNDRFLYFFRVNYGTPYGV